MMNDGSLAAGGAAFTFDTQAGITHLLASIRQSAITAEQKSELRDLVFLYTNGGKDNTVRIALEQKISAYQLTPAPQKVTASVIPPAPPIGTYRPAPSFYSPAPASAPVQPAPTNFTAAPVWQSAPVVVPPSVQPAPVAPVQISVAPVMPSAPVPSPVAQESVAAAPTIAADDQQFLKRIREIKALVNEKVGNPVNLVDINNEVGREYMGALLDAMKKLNSGSSAASAMQRLEQAFMAVEKALEVHAKNGAFPASAPTSMPVAPQPAPAPVVPPAATPTFVPPPVQEVRVAPAPVAQSPNVTFINDDALTKTGKLYVEDTHTPTPLSVPVSSPVSQAPAEEPTPWVAEPMPKPAATAQFSSLADVKDKPRTLSDVPTSASLKTASVDGDPLFTKEVDDGLQQLLLEWPIFKKSGMFGSGPKGREHPLFKKMAPLQIPLLLAGRFEGATQETKQSVTDYMNGWRYEQGLIYQQGETFEHYLRRVIRHILDLQKGK